ncbi:TlpA family protein disulfide reductase [Pseudothauera nasutitermitis]|uniref:TlpA family protein disulfide reductase n=1 Tax=Pseudothauera nasutitermitis TaxID=2565930 RepID=A0A4S4B693_9RHOO|nr:TlpA disulfide reductase family protein [Pseudothauera nasutitermitis]THF67346.1 TlpA family protein disulfide reductase [Pseudothauera nasutitermitis]
MGRVLLCCAVAFAPNAGAAGVDSLFAATLVGTDGGEMALADYRGKPLVVNFWARWCVPCRTELPELAALQAEYAERGLTVLGIAVEDDPAAVREFLAAYGVKYPVGLGRSKAIWLMQTLGNTGSGMPFTLVIDRHGEIVLRKLGLFHKADFEAVAGSLLE